MQDVQLGLHQLMTILLKTNGQYCNRQTIKILVDLLSLILLQTILDNLYFYYAPVTKVRGHYVLPLSFLPSHIKSLCNQLLLEFLSNQFETLQKCYQPTEDVHVTF